MEATRLSEQQVSFFEMFGYRKFPGLFSDRIDAIIEVFEENWRRHGGGHHGQPHDGTARSCLVPFVDRSEYLCTLLDDPRLLGIAYSLVFDHVSS